MALRLDEAAWQAPPLSHCLAGAAAISLPDRRRRYLTVSYAPYLTIFSLSQTLCWQKVRKKQASISLSMSFLVSKDCFIFRMVFF